MRAACALTCALTLISALCLTNVRSLRSYLCIDLNFCAALDECTQLALLPVHWPEFLSCAWWMHAACALTCVFTWISELRLMNVRSMCSYLCIYLNFWASLDECAQLGLLPVHWPEFLCCAWWMHAACALTCALTWVSVLRLMNVRSLRSYLCVDLNAEKGFWAALDECT